MAILLVSYDLSKEFTSRDYNALLNSIRSVAWARISESSYAIDTDLHPESVYQKLKQYLDENDNLAVITLSQPIAGRVPQDVADWLNQRLS
jgi:hypothetical protein